MDSTCLNQWLNYKILHAIHHSVSQAQHTVCSYNDYHISCHGVSYLEIFVKKQAITKIFGLFKQGICVWVHKDN